MDNIIELYNKAPKGDELKQKASEAKAQEPKTAIIDPLSMNGIMGVKQKPSGISFTMLRRMAQVPAISAIILTRKNQVARYARRPRFDGDLGFKIGLKDRSRKMTEAEIAQARALEDFFMKTGAVPNKRRKDNFNQFLRKVVDDTLTLDALVWENVENIKGQLAEFWAVDASTIEVVANNPSSETFTIPVYEPETRGGAKIRGDIAYIQRVNGRIVAEYTEEEIAYGIRNPRTALDYVDFGHSELEMLIEIVTAIMNSIRYNSSYFNHSNVPQGVLEMVGNYEQEHLEAFKRHWKILTTGASGKWATPIMAFKEGQGFKFTPFKTSNKDMEFNQFLEFLFNIACAVYQIDPNEVGFKSWTSNTGGQMKSDNTSEKIDTSKDKGFIPLMNFLSDTFNSEIVDRINPDMEFAWVGVDEEDEDRKWERSKAKLESGYTTVNMLRKENDEEEIDEDWANAPANAQLIQVYMSEVQAKQAEAQQQQANDGADKETQVAQKTANDTHAKALEASNDSHSKQLELTDKQHQQQVELEKMKQEHQIKLEKVKAENKPKPAPAKSLKKSLDGEDDELEVTVTWEDY